MKALVILTCAALSVGSVSGASAAPNIPEGMSRSIACQACHGGDGIALSNDVPNLAGQKAQYLIEQLKSFKSGTRKHDVMSPIAQQLSEADVANLAAFWNSLPNGGSKRDPAAPAALARGSTMTFPTDFPTGFTAYRTDESAEDKSISRYYANTVALQAARDGKSLPDGAVIVVAFSAPRLGADGQLEKDAQGHLIAEAPKSYSAMEVRAGAGDGVPELLRNGDWRYGLFNAQHTRIDKVNYAMCLGCHKAVAADSYVFTLKQIAAHATAGT